MAKVSRTILKSLVKECLVEILSEGLISTSNQIQELKQPMSRQPIPRKKVITKRYKSFVNSIVSI